MTRAPRQLAVVTIDCTDYLLPLADATRLVTLISQALRVERDWSARPAIWTVDRHSPVQAQLAILTPDQVRERAPAGREPRRITQGDAA